MSLFISVINIMFRLSLLLISMIYWSCTNEKPSTKSEDKISTESNIDSVEYDSGVLKLLYTGFSYSEFDSIHFCDLKGATKMSLTPKNLWVGNRIYDLFDVDHDTLSKYLDIKVFDLDYSLCVFQTIGIKSNSYLILSGSDTLLLPKSEYIKFSTFPQYLINNRCGLNELSPLREQPSDTSKIVVDDFKMYSFKIVQQRADWLKLICDKDVHGPDCEISGWVKWKEGNKWLIDIEYGF